MVRQFSRSAIRDWAVCRIGALWPSSRPATTTAITPEAWTCSAATYAANGTTSDIAAVEHRVGDGWRRTLATTRKKPKPTSTPPPAATQEVERRPRADVEALAVGRPRARCRSATRAVASLSSDSPSRIVTIRRGSPIRRPIAVAATASGGATTAPIAKAIGQRDAGQQQVRTPPTPSVGERDQPDRQQQDRPPVGVEVDQRGALRGGVQQRRQQPEQHDVLGELDLRHHRDVRRRDTDGDQQERRRDVQPLGHPGARQHPHRQAAEQQGDLHGGHSPDGRRGYLAVPLSAQSGSSGNTPP